MATRIQLRRGNANAWLSTNPILSSGELGLELDTNRFKIGDSSNTWANLAYFSPAIGTTSNLAEGANLYFTNTRAVGAFSQGSGIVIAANGLISSTALGGVTSVNGSNGNVQLFYTSNTEPASNTLGTFWYKPDEGNIFIKVNDGSANIWLEIDTPFFSYTANTTDVIEGANLYFTNTRAVSALTPGAGISIASNGLLTVTVTGGGGGGSGNGNITAVAGITEGAVSNIQLANAVYSTGIFTTSNVVEGSNLYFTNTRSIGAMTAGAGISIAANGLISSITSGVLNTSNVLETSGNLYFTNTRAVSALTSGRGVEVAANGLITSLYNIESIAGVANGVVSNIQIAFAIQDTALLNTANIIEGGNLYYTNARVAANVATLGYAPNAYVNTRLLTKANVSEITPLASNSHVTAVVNLLQTTKANNEDVTNLTTANIPEGGNLYFTNTRAVSAIYTDDSLILDANGRLIANIAAVGGGTITSVAGINFGGVSNVQLAAALVDRTVSVANITVTETATINQLRVTGDMSVTGTTTFINTTEVAINDKNLVLANGAADASVADGAGISISGAYANLTYYNFPNRFNFNRYVDIQGNTILTNANTTTHITEGNNLYFTNTRAVGAFTAAGGLSLASNGYIVLNQTNVAVIATTSVVPATIDYDVGLVNNNYSISPYSGQNPELKVFAGQTIAFDLGTGLGIANHPFTIRNTYSGTNVTTGLSLYFNNGTSTSNPSQVQGNVTGRLFWKIPPSIGGNTYVYQSTSNANVYGNIIIYTIGTGTSGGGDVLTVNGSNGNVQLYYTSNTAPNSNTLGTLWYKPDEGNIYFYVNDGTSNIWLEIDQAAYTPVVASVNGESGDVVLTTANIAESGNLYFTNNRVQLYLGNVSGNIVPSANETYSLGSPTNKWKDLYLSGNTIILGNTKLESAGDGSLSIKSTNAQVTSAISFSSNGYIASEAGTYTTANVAEQGNLYFTNARVYSNVISLGYATTTHVTNEIANLVASAPSTLNTLNELAIALANDASFATTVTNSLATKANIASLTTANVTEVSNLYFTNTRAISSLTSGAGISIASNGRITSTALGVVQSVNGANGNVVLTTANIAESGNLYFTNTRAIYALTAGANISIASNGRITALTQGGGGGASTSDIKKISYAYGIMFGS